MFRRELGNPHSEQYISSPAASVLLRVGRERKDDKKRFHFLEGPAGR